MEVLDQLIDDTEVTAPLSADWYLAVYIETATTEKNEIKLAWEQGLNYS